MILDHSTTEAFAIYNNFHNNLNLTSKVATASVATVRRIVDVPNGDKIMGQLIDTLNMPWGAGKNFPNPLTIIDNVIQNLNYNYIVQAFSGFEFYLTHLIADLAHFSPLKDTVFVHAHVDSEYNPLTPPAFPRCCFAYAEQNAKNYVLAARLSSLVNDLGVKDSTFDRLIPLFDYFRLVRNCVAHLEGMANKDLEEHYHSDELKESYDFWNNSFARKKAPRLAPAHRGKKLELNITHSIFASAVNYKIGQLLNSKAIEVMGIDGVVKMACYYSLLVDKHDYRDIRVVNSADAAVSNFLSNRYLVQDVNSESTIAELIKMNLWKVAIKRFKVLKDIAASPTA